MRRATIEWIESVWVFRARRVLLDDERGVVVVVVVVVENEKRRRNRRRFDVFLSERWIVVARSTFGSEWREIIIVVVE